MKKLRSWIIAILMLLTTMGACSQSAFAQMDPFLEMRYCGAPPRDAKGEIMRRSDVLTVFKRVHTCPVAGKPDVKPGTCPGWEIDHVIPLVCGGCDAVSNLQWLPKAIKRARVIGKDAFEQKVYCKVFGQ